VAELVPRKRRAILPTILKRMLVGHPVSYHAELQHRVPKRIALAVFSSDALSSSAYATDVMLAVLAAAGTVALTRSIPIALGVVCVLGIVISSYRTVVRAYPQGGGGYTVARENLGLRAGVVVAAALLVDYVLTVAVRSRRACGPSSLPSRPLPVRGSVLPSSWSRH
jgi:hypothetical protein